MPSDDPITLFLECRARAVAAGAPLEGADVILATATPDGVPSARSVLVREVDAEGFFLYTNYRSRKASELDANPRAALSVHWPQIAIAFRIEGAVVPAGEARSDSYFATRPRDSQIGAWASEQSEPIASREELLAKVAEVEARFAGRDVPRPPHWGGYRVIPERIEQWVNGPHRLHDRFLYVREGAGWRVTRLSP